MKDKIILKYTENGIIDYLADKDKDYAESISDEKKKEFCKEIAKRIEPLWKDIYDYENGNIFKRIRVILESLLLSKKGNANIPHPPMQINTVGYGKRAALRIGKKLLKR